MFKKVKHENNKNFKNKVKQFKNLKKSKMKHSKLRK